MYTAMHASKDSRLIRSSERTGNGSSYIHYTRTKSWLCLSPLLESRNLAETVIKSHYFVGLESGIRVIKSLLCLSRVTGTLIGDLNRQLEGRVATINTPIHIYTCNLNHPSDETLPYVWICYKRVINLQVIAITVC